MDSTELAQEQAVIDSVSGWPPARRFALAHRILRDLERELVPRQRRKTL